MKKYIKPDLELNLIKVSDVLNVSDKDDNFGDLDNWED